MHTFWRHVLISRVKFPVNPGLNVVASIVYWPGGSLHTICELRPSPPSSSRAIILPSAPAPCIKYRYGSAPDVGEVRSTVTIASCVKVKL